MESAPFADCFFFEIISRKFENLRPFFAIRNEAAAKNRFIQPFSYDSKKNRKKIKKVLTKCLWSCIINNVDSRESNVAR